MKRNFKDLFIKPKTNEDREKGSVLFTCNCPEGYFSKAELVEFMHANLGWPNTHLEVAFEHMKNDGNLSRELSHITENGKGATWFNFKQGRVPKTCRIGHFGNIQQMLEDYASGKIKVTETLMELYQEATAE